LQQGHVIKVKRTRITRKQYNSIITVTNCLVDGSLSGKKNLHALDTNESFAVVVVIIFFFFSFFVAQSFFS